MCRSNNFGLCFRRPAMNFTESHGCWAFILWPLWWGQYLLWGTMGKSLNLCISSHTYIFFPNTPRTPESEKEGKTSMFLQGRSHCLCITYQIKNTTVMEGCSHRWAREFRCHSTNAVSICLLPLTLEVNVWNHIHSLLPSFQTDKHMWGSIRALSWRWGSPTSLR